jgi:Ulp1 family protease
MDRVFVPINIHNTHWTMMDTDVKACTITYCDSMGADGSKCVSPFAWCCHCWD